MTTRVNWVNVDNKSHNTSNSSGPKKSQQENTDVVQEGGTVAIGDSKHFPASKAVIFEELIEFCAFYMARGYKKFALKRKIEEELNLGEPFSIRTFEELRKLSRQLLKDTMLSPEEHKQNAINIIYQTVQDSSTSPSAKLRAAELLLTVSTSVTPEENEDRVAAIKQLLSEMEDQFDMPLSEEG